MDAAHSIGAFRRGAIPRRAPNRAGTHRAIAGGLLALVALFCAATSASAGSIYSYVDDKGVTHFTNRPLGDKRFRRVIFREDSRIVRPAPAHFLYDQIIDETARSYRVPPALVKAVVAAESAFDPRAVSRKGAKGLMQLMPQTAELLGVEHPLEPASNIRGGTEYLKAMIDRYGDYSRALAAYNAGPSAVDRYGGVPPYRETQDYVDRVLNYYRAYDVDFAR
jgi:soluble lytic murein transglycosylase